MEYQTEMVSLHCKGQDNPNTKFHKPGYCPRHTKNEVNMINQCSSLLNIPGVSLCPPSLPLPQHPFPPRTSPTFLAGSVPTLLQSL